MSAASHDLHFNFAEVAQRLADAYAKRGRDLNLSLEITQDILKDCEAAHSEEGVARAKNQLGLFYLIRGEFEKAEQYSLRALHYFEESKNIKGIADAHYNIGSIYYRTDKYHQGLVELLKSLDGYRQIGDFANQSRTLKSMGTIYEYFNDLNKAVDSYEKAIDASHKVNDASLESNALNPLSGIYYKQGLEKLAIETIDRSIYLKTITQDIRGLAFALYGRAKIYIKRKQPLLALPDLEKAISILTSAEDMLGLGMAYNKLGLAYDGLNDLDNARQYFLGALELGEKYHVQFIRFKANFNLYQLAKKQGDSISALEYLEKYFFQKEQVINTDTINIIKSYEALSKIEGLERAAITQIEKNDIIEKKNEELDSFFYRISHDLKGPISSLLGLHSIIKMDVKDETALKIFSMCHAQVVRMNDIVMGLINLTEIKNTEKLKVVIDFDVLIDECVNSCQYLTNFSKIKIEKSIHVFDFKSEWAIINTVLQNLIENAIKYSRSDHSPYVKITIRKENNHLDILVEDNGEGISADHQANIFKMFYRANNQEQGSGLGLYIVKRAVERLNGNINFTSTPQVGSSFHVILPG